jgi:hypothetical protein
VLQRFHASAAEMRGVAQEIQREIEATRQEVRRGAAELPRETAEQAAEMRRVVAEQVEALAELSGIVARSGRVLDVAEPAAPEFRASGDTQRSALESPAQMSEATRPARARTAETPTAREPARGSAPTTKSAPAHPPAARGPGWLTDLLARASRDEEDVSAAAAPPPAAPRQSSQRASESLDSLSADIARMINHDAVVEQWDRYYRGERQPFSRKLYTPQGQQTFDEIRRRYPLDRDFREAVDRYTAEFERVVNESSREDRDGSVVRNYLTSETGKVYTMLAHAAGRFD